MASDSEFTGTFSGGPTELNSGQDLAEQAARAAREARGGEVRGGEAVGQARRILDNAADALGAKSGPLGAETNTQLNEAMNVAGRQLYTAAQQVRQLAPQGAPIADALERGGSYLQSTDPNSALGDLEQLIKRYPLQALGVGLGIGFFIGRSGK